MAPTKVRTALVLAAAAAAGTLSPAAAFVCPSTGTTFSAHDRNGIQSTARIGNTAGPAQPLPPVSLPMATDGEAEASSETKAAPLVTGEQLEIMLTEWDEPLVVDAYATW